MKAYALTEEAKDQYHGCGYARCTMANGMVTGILAYHTGGSLENFLHGTVEPYILGMMSCYQFCVLSDLELLLAIMRDNE